jgi:ABC-type molybdate transport system substrate-binding protein
VGNARWTKLLRPILDEYVQEKKAMGLDDLTRKGVRVSIGDPKAPAIGRVAKKLLTKAHLWESVQPNIRVYAPTVNQLLIYVALNQVDAAIIWQDLTTWAEAKGKIEVIAIDAKRNIIKTIPTAVCTRTKNHELAIKFNDYVFCPMYRHFRNGTDPCRRNLHENRSAPHDPLSEHLIRKHGYGADERYCTDGRLVYCHLYF